MTKKVSNPPPPEALKPKPLTAPRKEGVPCNHAGCLNHLTHPCEVCGRKAGKERKPARLHFTLVVNCQHCKEEIDLTDGCYESMYIIPIFSDRWEDLKGESVTCTHCSTEFQLSGVEY